MLGEDAGIEVEALDWGPGTRSARWSERPIDDLLAALEGARSRRARYRCAIVAIGPDGREVVTEGRLAGSVAHEPRGTEGFGYDPIFVPDGEEATVAQLGDDWKSVNSARARAAAALRPALGAS
jgi:XTP/dITP diphosphohydrolase